MQNMLEFWFNPQLSIAKKILFLMLIIIITAGLYLKYPLSLDAILMFLGTGIIFLICRYCRLHFVANRPTGMLYRLLTWIPIALLLALIFMNIKNNEILMPYVQGLGFMCIAICVFSPMALLRKNSLEDQ